MVEYVSGDIFSWTAEEVDAIVIPTNCEGVFGAGLAKQCAERRVAGKTGEGVRSIEAYSTHIRDYQEQCKEGLVKPGDVRLYTIWTDPPEGFAEMPRGVIFIPTKDKWANPSQIEWIERALGYLPDVCKTNGLSTIAMPLIGTGLGALNAKTVGRLIVQTFKEDADVKVYLHLPDAMMVGVAKRGV